MINAITRLVVTALCVAFPHTTFAATIVWEAFGVTDALTQYGKFPGPPRATQWALELRFDPDLSVHTPYWPADAPCTMTPIAGSFTLGRTQYAFGGGSNTAFTNAILPVNNCGSNPDFGIVQFFMFPGSADDPWHLQGSAGSCSPSTTI